MYISKEIKQTDTYYIYRIIDNSINEIVPCYFQFGGDKYDFDSVESARESNCHGIFKDKDKYRIAKFKVAEELEDEDCDPITEEDQIEINIKKKIADRINKIIEKENKNSEIDYCSGNIYEPMIKILEKKRAELIDKESL